MAKYSRLKHQHKGQHDQVGTRAYNSWKHMKARCSDPNHESYKYYGAKGITVCERWLDFKNFFEDMGLCPEGMTLERINNDGNYEPENCQWATRKAQSRNTRRNTFFTRNGQTKCAAEWCEMIANWQ